MINWLKYYFCWHTWQFRHYDYGEHSYHYECSRCGCTVEDEAYD